MTLYTVCVAEKKVKEKGAGAENVRRAEFGTPSARPVTRKNIFVRAESHAVLGIEGRNDPKNMHIT